MEKAEENLELITQYFSDFTSRQIDQLRALERLYREWNGKINVISRKDKDSLYEKHVLHSLSIAAAFDLQAGMNVIDLGTGGGFPGIPLAIFFPDVRFHLVDSIGKKIKVVNAVAESLELKNVTTQHTRVEDIGDRKFDVVVSRAVAPLDELWKWSRKVLRKGKIAEGRRQTGNGERQMADVRRPNFNSLPVPHGLISLKGGALSNEIAQSGLRPRMMEIYEIFPEEVFKEKYILYVPSGGPHSSF
jgi:16S rRNA (guanine527-N7)-methyltransferase